MRSLLCLATLCGLCAVLPAHAVDHVISQKGKNFSQRRLVVQPGDSVKFVNDDPFNHNVFSLSETTSFDLGSYGQGLAKTVVMDKPGAVEVECAVHPDMKIVIEVKK